MEKERFPENFCFQLSDLEFENLRSQIVTSSLKKENYGGRRYLPYAFTEQGIAMLSGLLKNKIAVQVSINIMNAFVEMRQFLSFKGQIYDAYDLIIKLIKSAQNDIFIIDNYIDDSILKMLSKKLRNVKVSILTSFNCNIIKLDIEKFNQEYPTLKIVKTNKFHDRFMIIDHTQLYHIGASLKDLGQKCFAISKIEDLNLSKIVKFKI